MTNTRNTIDQDKAQLSDNINETTEDHEITSSTSDIKPLDRENQTALAKAEGKLETAQRLFQSAEQRLEQTISEFLRVTIIPGGLNESKTTNATYEKRIRTLQEAKKELKKRISTYQSDITRIQAEEIPQQLNSPPTLLNDNTGTANINQNSNAIDAIQSSSSNSISYEVGNSKFHIDWNFDRSCYGDKSNQKHDIIIPADMSAIEEIDKSPSAERRLSDDSNVDVNDGIYDQLMMEIDFMQKQIDSLVSINKSQHKQNERLNDELTDLRQLQENFLYNFNYHWTEVMEKVDKLDRKTSKVEQTLIYAHDPPRNEHRLISKLVNILLSVFAIILLLLSTIKNLVQSRVHAVIFLIFVFTWITIHHLPENYSQSPFFQDFKNVLEQSS